MSTVQKFLQSPTNLTVALTSDAATINSSIKYR